MCSTAEETSESVTIWDERWERREEVKDSSVAARPPKKSKFKEPSEKCGVTNEGPEVVSTKIKR